jgi:hypothetical protein
MNENLEGFVHQIKQKYPWIGPLFGPSLWFITGWWFGTWLLFFHILGTIIPSD